MGVLPSVCTVLLSLRRLLCLSGLLLSMLPLRSQAQISLDGSLGPRGALTGPNYVIPAAVGQIRGPNLFHSFDQFNLRLFQGESATFTGPNTITNILSRVTGGSPSIIDGLLRSQIPGAHLYLFNPSGVMFGPNASLDVSGSFHVSTADYMRLADGARFSAHLSETSTLSVAPPAAFGFLGPSPARIDILGSTLEVSEGQTLSVIGGDIGITSVLSTPKLSAPAGRIHLVSVASSGEVVFDSTGQDPAPQVTSFARLGAINLQEARLDVSGDGAGTVVIRGGRLLVANASITAITGDRDGANMGIDLRLAEDVVVDNSIIHAGSTGHGNVGEIRAEAGTLTLRMGAVISSHAFGLGKGGNITVSARESVSISGQNDQGASGITTFATADPGRLSLSAPNVTIDGGVVGTPSLAAEGFVGGRGGDIVVKADNLTLAGGKLSAETDGTGRAGDILIDAGQLTLTRGALITSSSSSRATGAAGTIRITSTTMDMQGDAFIKSDTFDGPGGTIKITADTLSMTEVAGSGQPGSPMITVATQGTGNAGDIVIKGRQVALTGNTILIDSSTSVGSGRGGTVTIHATDSITLAGRTDMEPSGGFVPGFVEGSFGITSNAGRGDGGKVSIMTPVLTMTRGTVITTSTGGDGRAGDIKITVDRLSLTGGSQINSSSGNVQLAPDQTFLVSAGTGNAGTVKVTAKDAIFIAGRDSTGIASSEIATTTRGSGQGGRVSVSTPQLIMADGGQITAETQGAGRGGDVVVRVGHLSLTGGAQIRSGSVRGETLLDVETREPIPGQGTGPGGTVTVTATDTVSIAGRSSTGGGSLLSNDPSSGLFSTTQGPGAAGEIVVSTPTLTMSEGGKISVSTAGAGRAGDITVHSGNLTLTGGALIDSSTNGAGPGGVVTVTASDVIQNTQSSVTTNTRGSGDAGLVSLTAPTIEVTDGRISAVTSGIGKAGNVVVNVGRLTLKGQAQIDSSSRGAGQGGSVTVAGTDTLAFSGPGGLLSNAAGTGAAGTVSVMAPALRMDNAATIEARTTGDGHAGNVEVHVGQLTVLGGAHISSTSGMVDATGTVVAGAGRGGTVTVTATDMIAMAGRDSTGGVASGVFSQTFGIGEAGRVTVSTPQLTLAAGGRIGADTGGDGLGGDVVVRVGSASLSGGAQINSGSGITVGSGLFIGAGAGGTVALTATDAVTITGQDSGLSASTRGGGRGGDITLQAQGLTLTDGARLAAESTGPGNAGNITVTTQAPFLLTNGSVVTRATQADGGNIQISTPTLLRLRDSTITAVVGGGASTVGGNITIDPQFVLLQHSQIIANAFAGTGGTIDIQAQQVFLADPLSQVSATSTLGINGQVNIQAPVTNISGAVAPLPQAFAQTAELLRSRCAERLREGTVSRFVVGGRDGVPLEPGSLLLSPLERVGQEGGGPGEERESPTSEAQQGGVWYAQAQAPGGLEVECARWRGKAGTAVPPKRLR